MPDSIIERGYVCRSCGHRRKLTGAEEMDLSHLSSEDVCTICGKLMVPYSIDAAMFEKPEIRTFLMGLKEGIIVEDRRRNCDYFDRMIAEGFLIHYSTTIKGQRVFRLTPRGVELAKRVREVVS